MSFGDSQYQSMQPSMWGDIAARAIPNERADFIKKTYLHLLAAVLAFCGLENVYMNTSIAQNLAGTMLGGGRIGWLVVLSLCMVVSWLANYWAMSSTSVGMQYT